MAHQRKLLNSALCSLGSLLLLAASCPSQEPVNITFDQLGACNGYRQTSGPGGSGPHHDVNAGPHAAFLVFRLVSIVNNSGKDFNFDPERLYLSGSSPREFVDTGLALAQDHGQLKAIATTIRNGTNSGGGIAVVVVSTSAANGASEANNSSYGLAYDTAVADPGVLLTKRNLSQTSWPNTEDCRGIDFLF